MTTLQLLDRIQRNLCQAMLSKDQSPEPNQLAGASHTLQSKCGMVFQKILLVKLNDHGAQSFKSCTHKYLLQLQTTQVAMDSLYIIFLNLLQTIDSLGCHVEWTIPIHECDILYHAFWVIVHYSTL